MLMLILTAKIGHPPVSDGENHLFRTDIYSALQGKHPWLFIRQAMFLRSACLNMGCMDEQKPFHGFL